MNQYISDYEERAKRVEEWSYLHFFIQEAQIYGRKIGKSCNDVASCIPILKERDESMGHTQEMTEALEAAYQKGRYPDSPLFFESVATSAIGIAGNTP